MRKFKELFLLTVLGIGCIAHASEGWFDDFSKAQARAQEKNSPLLVAFLGPNWCPWSDKLEEEVLTSNAFFASLKDEVVLLRVDIPEDFDQKTFAGSVLKQRYQIEECPSLVLAQSSGQEIARFEYLPVKTKDVALVIKERIADFKKVAQLTKKKQLKSLKTNELKSLYTKAGKLADTTFKKALLRQGLKSDHDPYFLLEEYEALVTKGKSKDRQSLRVRNKILARDPQNSKGCLRQLALMDFEALANNNEKALQAKAVVDPLISYLNEFGKEDVDNAWQIEMKVSQYLFSHDQPADALKHARASLRLAPQAAREEITQSIEYLQAFVQ